MTTRRLCRLAPERLKLVSDWAGSYRTFEEESFSRLGDDLDDLQSQDDPTCGPRRRDMGTATPELDRAPDDRALETTTPEPVQGGTVMVGTSLFCSVEARDAQIAAGMGGGMRESYERLDELVAGLAATAG